MIFSQPVGQGRDQWRERNFMWGFWMSRKPASAVLSVRWMRKARVPAVAMAVIGLLISSAAPAASASTPRTHSLTPEPPREYHYLDLYQRVKVFANPIVQGAYPNCSGTFGIGSGECGGDRVYHWGSTPQFGDRNWTLSWAPCNGQCPAGAIFIQAYAGDSRITGWIPDRSKGELTVLSAHVPSWHPLSPITGGDNPALRASTSGGPLFLDVSTFSSGSEDRYDIRIRGYLRYARFARTYDVSGYLHYGKHHEPATYHAFHAHLDVLDTPSSPQCSNDNFVGNGGCYGTFTSGSDAPFIGSGGQAGIHWIQSGQLPGVSLIAPSGSRLHGYLGPQPGALTIGSGSVPEFGATTNITSGSFPPLLGQPGGPLHLRTTTCCSALRTPPAPKLTRVTAAVSGHEATLSFRSVDQGHRAGAWCQLDRRPWGSCKSGKTYHDLSTGRHRLRVWGVYEGAIDRQPATKWIATGSG